MREKPRYFEEIAGNRGKMWNYRQKLWRFWRSRLSTGVQHLWTGNGAFEPVFTGLERVLEMIYIF